MKRITLLILAFFLTTGCSLTKDDLEDAQIYTTVYPIEYLVNLLYGQYSTIESIYPAGADIATYELTEKQIKDYAQADIFVYNGLSDEKTITKNLINENNDLLIIDVSYGLDYIYGIEELWMSPNNCLMLAKNIRNYLTDFLTSKYIIEEVNNNYDEFAEDISLMDADLRSIGKDAAEKGTNTLVVTNDVFYFLQDYGFNIISLDAETATEATISNMKNAFKKGTYDSIIIVDNQTSDAITDIISDENITKIYVSTMLNTTKEDDPYINQMQQFIDNIRNLTLSD